MENLLTIAAEYGTQVKLARLDGGIKGFYDPISATIYLSRRLTPAEMRCTLAHELGHVYWGHDCTSPMNENQANDYACRLLIAPEAYAQAEQINSDISFIADELDVLPEYVEHFQTFSLQRLGDKTYAREAHHQRIA